MIENPVGFPITFGPISLTDQPLFGYGSFVPAMGIGLDPTKEREKMSIKKMLLLASMALTAIAFAVPATASANQITWTKNHVPLKAGEVGKQIFEGFLDFEAVGAPIPSSFGCDVTVTVEAIGPTGGKVKVFNPTTSTCKGTGVLAGCVLTQDKTNITNAAGVEKWGITLTGTHGVVKHTDAGEDITFHNEYHGCPTGLTTSHLLFKEITVVPTVDATHTIKHLTIAGTTTDGALRTTGSVTPETPTKSDPDNLGLITDVP